MDYEIRYLDNGIIHATSVWNHHNLPMDDFLVFCAGVLFVNSWCPGESWCVYLDGDQEKPVLSDSMDHCYGHNPDLWDSETEVWLF